MNSTREAIYKVRLSYQTKGMSRQRTLHWYSGYPASSRASIPSSRAVRTTITVATAIETSATHMLGSTMTTAMHHMMMAEYMGCRTKA